MPGCAAVKCTNSDKKGFLMKHFPRDPLRRETWAMNVKRGDDWYPTDHSCLCEVHFAPEMWEKPRVDGKRILKASAIPTIFSFAKKKTVRKSPVQRKPLSPKKPKLSSDEASVVLPPIEALSTSSADLEVDSPATQKSSSSLSNEEKRALVSPLLLEISKGKDIIAELQAKLDRYEKYYVRERNKAMRYKNLLRQARNKLQVVPKVVYCVRSENSAEKELDD